MAWHKEGRVEDYLVKRVKETGGQIRKVQWIGTDGAPDRFCWWDWPVAAFVECKALGKPLKGPQVTEIKTMRRYGVPVLRIDSREGVDDFIAEMMGQLYVR